MLSQSVFHSTFMGLNIERNPVNGYYKVFVIGQGQFVADTLAGIKERIRELRKEGISS